MRIDQYLEEQGLTQAALASLLDPPVTQSLVSQWIRGRTRITLEQALGIERLTSGKVSPQDCAAMFRDHASA
jgi:DNA-binding transcriptional regulator YdaS (Cro superfamily)